MYEAETNAYTDTLNTKLNAIEALADVTDTTNVTAAGALMDSEVTNLAQVKAFDSSDYATAAQGTTADAALPKAGGTMTGTLAMGANAITSTGTISSGAITSSGAIISTDSGNRLDALSIGDDSDIYLYEGSTNVLNIRTGASGSYKYFTFQDDGYFNTNSGGISTGGTARITSTGNLTNIGTISSGGITSSSGITATGPFKSGGSNNYILFDYDGDFTGGNYYAIQDTSANRLRISYGFSATDNLELDASGNFYVNGGNATFAGTTSSTGLVLNGGRTAEGVTAAGTYAELTRASGGDLGLLFNKDTSKWLIGIDNSDGNAANLRFMYGAYNASIHPGFGSDYSGLNLTYQGRVGVGTRYPGAELEVAGTALVENAKLKAIAESNTDTAVDVFVYDTRKDSDGGAWRKRTQNTSWYNETLNTSTRGARKEFPSVAVIVALPTAGNNVTIYDGDDPDLPMWMKFTLLNQDQVSIAAINGLICLGNKWAANAGYGGNGLVLFDFVADRSRHAMSNGTVPSYDPERLGVISGNQASTSIWPKNSANAARFYTLVDYNINDVAMTVLPNAPIDADTGLPIPTIAVATNGGVSVIKDDGNVYDLSGSNWAAVSYTVDFDQKGILYFSQRAYAAIGCDVKGLHQDYTSMVDGRPSFRTGLDAYPFFQAHGEDGNGWGHSSADYATGSRNDFDLVHWSYYTHPFGRLVRHQTNHDLWNEYRGDSDLMNYTGPDYNTGWMHGDIKLATLSDTDTTNVTGSELVTNGTFDSNTTGWTASDAGCSLSLVSNQLRITNNDATAGGAVTSFSVVSGEVYTFSVGTSSGTVQLYLGAAPNTAIYFGPVISNSTTWTSTVTGTVYFMVKNVSTTNGATVDIDNISVRLAEEDRSVNNNGLQVFGTVTKTAVATGAELVGYSGFSTSNYLQQPYNSDLDFGTGDFALMCWAYTSSSSYGIHETYISRAGRAFDISKTTLENYRFYITPATYISTTSVNYNTWVHIVALRRNGRCSIYIDGIEQASGTVTTNIAPGYSDDDQLMIGLRRASGLSQPSTNSKLALARISATAPSEEQIAKMYNDEKHLFQENAKATLYGSSNAVTALAYDDDTELLHVGTSAGRSVFQGLNRVDNTTDAVGAAISASNGFIVED